MPSRADAHRHQHIKKWRLDFQNAWTHLIDEIEENFVVGQIAEGGHEKLRIKSDGKIAPLIHYRKRFAGLAHLRRVGGDLDVVLAETELDRIRFVARQQRYPAQRVEKGLAFERDTLLRFRRNHLFVIRIIPFDQFRDQQRTIKIECDLTGAHADLHVAIIGKQACQFRDCLCRNNDVRFVTARKFQFEVDHGKAAPVRCHERKFILFIAEENTIEYVTRLVSRNGISGLAQTVAQILLPHRHDLGVLKLRQRWKFFFWQSEDLEETLAAPNRSRVFAIDLD